MKKIMINQSALISQTTHVFFYYLMILAFHVFLLSIVAFFHFLLDHSLGTIEEWVHDHAWDLVIITKISVLGAMYKIAFDMPLRNIFKWENIPIKDTVVVIIFFYVVLLIYSKPILKDSVDFLILSKSFIGVLIFYITDLLFWVALQRIYKLQTMWSRYFSILTLSCFLFFSARISFFNAGLSWMTLIFIGFSLYLATWRKMNYVLPLLFICFFICPVSALFGADPIWGSSYSLFDLKNPIGAINMLILLLVAFQYLLVKEIGFIRFMDYLSLIFFRRRVWKRKG